MLASNTTELYVRVCVREKCFQEENGLGFKIPKEIVIKQLRKEST